MFLFTQQRSAGPQALPTGRGMVPKGERARKRRNPASGAKPEAYFVRFCGICGMEFSWFEKLVRQTERHYSESAGFFLPAAIR
jgi:hypothetical protein